LSLNPRYFFIVSNLPHDETRGQWPAVLGLLPLTDHD